MSWIKQTSISIVNDSFCRLCVCVPGHAQLRNEHIIFFSWTFKQSSVYVVMIETEYLSKIRTERINQRRTNNKQSEAKINHFAPNNSMCVRIRIPQLQWNFVILSRLFMNTDSIWKGMIVILFWMDLIFEMNRKWIVGTIDWFTFCFEIVLAIAYNIVQRNHFRSINNRYSTLKTKLKT